jgi:hypothetical protein
LARAKRTDRTEARRRHRAEVNAIAPESEAAEDAPAPVTRGGTAKSTAGAAPAARPSIAAALRGSFRPLDLRGDILAIPRVVTHWALLASVVVAIVATATFIASTNELGASLDFSLSDPFAGKSISSVSNVSYLVVSLFVAPPPAAGAFLVGFTAARASWIGGLVYGIVAAFCYGAIVASPAGRLLTGNSPSDAFLVNAVALGPLGAALFASAAAWYRRFLNLANPNRGRRPVRGGNKPKPRNAAARSGSRSR